MDTSSNERLKQIPGGIELNTEQVSTLPFYIFKNSTKKSVYPHHCRKKRKGKGGRAKIKPTGCLHQEGPDQPPEKLPNKTSPEDTRSKPSLTADDQQERVPGEREEVLVPANQGTEEMEIKKNVGGLFFMCMMLPLLY